MKTSLLYVSNDGVLEPLGQSQVLAYLEQFAKGRPIHLLSFEKPEDWERESVSAGVQQHIVVSGAHWHLRRYHKQPSSLTTALDIGIGALTALWFVLRHRVGMVHAHSYVAAVMAWLVTGSTYSRLLFDMHGFWAYERVDGGLRPRGGRMYRIAKWFECKFSFSADYVIALVHAGLREVQAFDYLQGRTPPVTVIPTWPDSQRFKALPICRGAGLAIGTVGSAGTWYLLDAFVEIFKQLLNVLSAARLLIINHNSHDYTRERLSSGCVGRSISGPRREYHVSRNFRTAAMCSAARLVASAWILTVNVA